MSKEGEDVTVASPVTLSLARSFFSLSFPSRVLDTDRACNLSCLRSLAATFAESTRSFPFVFALVEGQPPSHCMLAPHAARVCVLSLTLSFLPVRVCSRRSIHATLVRFVRSFRETIVESLTVVSRPSP